MRDYGGLPRTVWVLALMVLVNRAGSMVLPFMSLYLTNVLGAAPEVVGRVLTVYGIGALIGVTGGGWLVDHFSPRLIMASSLSANAVCFLVLRHVTDIDTLTLAMLFIGAVGEVFRPGNAAALVAALPEDRRDRGFALHALAINLGISFGATLGGWLASGTYAALFYVDATTCIGAALVVLLLLPRDEAAVRTPAQTRDGAPRVAGGIYVRFSAFMTAFFVISVLFTQFFVTTTLYHDAYNHFSSRAIGALLAVNTVMVCVTQMPTTNRVARSPRLIVIAIGSLFFAGGFALLPISSSYAIAVLSVVVWTVGEVLVAPTINAHTAAVAPAGQIGRFMGINAAVGTLGRMVAPILGTMVYQHLGPNALWLGCAALAGVLALAYAAGQALPTRYEA